MMRLLLLLLISLFLACRPAVEQAGNRSSPAESTVPSPVTAPKLSPEHQKLVDEQVIRISGEVLLRILDKGDRRAEIGFFNDSCAVCHGADGSGQITQPKGITERPRDWGRGIFKRKSTAYGSRPTDTDLMRVILRGVAGSPMKPAEGTLNEDELRTMVDYTRALAQKAELRHRLTLEVIDNEELSNETADEIAEGIADVWRTAQENIVNPTTPEPTDKQTSIEKGRLAYFKLECNRCHAGDGRGGYPMAMGLDSWNMDPIVPDMRNGEFRCGDKPIDLYRAISTGVEGSTMPSFSEALKQEPETIWNLVHFIQNLKKEQNSK